VYIWSRPEQVIYVKVTSTELGDTNNDAQLEFMTPIPTHTSEHTSDLNTYFRDTELMNFRPE